MREKTQCRWLGLHKAKSFHIINMEKMIVSLCKTLCLPSLSTHSAAQSYLKSLVAFISARDSSFLAATDDTSYSF